MSWLTKLAMKQRWLTILIVVIITGVAVWSLFTLQMELIPDIELPMTSIVAVYPQAKPEVVMEEVTVKVESAVAGLRGLKNVFSTVSEGSSRTMAMFEYGTSMAEINRQIEHNLAAMDFPPAVRDLPLTMPQLGKNPRVYAIDINMLPVVILSLGGDVSPDELEQIALEEILPVLVDVDGVYHVTIRGGSNQQVLVELDPDRLADTGLSMSAVFASLSGREFQSVSGVEQAPLGLAGTPLGQVGTVKLGYPVNSSISRTNGQTSIAIRVMKTAEANTVSVAAAIRDAVKDLQPSLPGGIMAVSYTHLTLPTKRIV